MTRVQSLDEFEEQIPDEFRKSVLVIRDLISSLSDDLEERISYTTLFYYRRSNPIVYFNFSGKNAYLGFIRGQILTQWFDHLEGDTKQIRKLNIPVKISEEYLEDLRSIVLTALEVEDEIRNGNTPSI